jgi:hypothetical protein
MDWSSVQVVLSDVLKRIRNFSSYFWIGTGQFLWLYTSCSEEHAASIFEMLVYNQAQPKWRQSKRLYVDFKRSYAEIKQKGMEL